MAKFKTERQSVCLSDELDYHALEKVKLDDFITLLQDYRAKHGENAVFELELDTGYYDDYPMIHVRVTSVREESDDEYNHRYHQWQRLEKAKREATNKRRREREVIERQTYERLKKKFGSV